MSITAGRSGDFCQLLLDPGTLRWSITIRIIHVMNRGRDTLKPEFFVVMSVMFWLGRSALYFVNMRPGVNSL